MPEISAVVHSIMGIVVGITGAVFVICIVIAGLMRMLSFGNERRVAVSNMALTAAVVGLIIIMLAAAIQTWLSKIPGLSIPK